MTNYKKFPIFFSHSFHSSEYYILEGYQAEFSLSCCLPGHAAHSLSQYIATHCCSGLAGGHDCLSFIHRDKDCH